MCVCGKSFDGAVNHYFQHQAYRGTQAVMTGLGLTPSLSIPGGGFFPLRLSVSSYVINPWCTFYFQFCDLRTQDLLYCFRLSVVSFGVSHLARFLRGWEGVIS